MDLAAYVYITSVVFLLLFIALVLRTSCDGKKSNRRRRNRERRQRNEAQRVQSPNEDDSRQQQQHVFNISSRVQGHEHQFPTGDAHLSLDQINIMNELNKPIYDDAPPSYEEAMKIAIAMSNSTSSTSGSAGTQQVVVPAIPKTTD